jgi:hypothetical protein
MIHVLVVIFLKPLVVFCVASRILFKKSVMSLQVGDPLEKAALKGIDWSYKADEKALPRR